jgi:peptidoglycan/LPS O-acetylase OafA/YrhL
MLDAGVQGVVKLLLEMVASLSEAAFAVACFILLVRWLKAERGGRFNSPVIAGMARIGLISYSLYLIHVPTIYALNALLPDIHAYGFFVRLVVDVTGCLLMAWLFFQIIEKRFLGSSVHTLPKVKP